jgi:hypothetical protein
MSSNKEPEGNHESNDILLLTNKKEFIDSHGGGNRKQFF